MTLLTRFLENVKRRPSHTAVHYFNNGHKYSLNWQQTYDFIESYFQGLQQLGVAKGDSVSIYSNTCKEWGFLDLAIMASGAKTVPLYHSSPVEDVEYVLAHCGAKILIIENETLYNKIKNTSIYKEQITKAILINEFKVDDPKCIYLKDIITEDCPIAFEDSIRSVRIEDDATVIYTSGTSGEPKGVLLTHEQVLSSVTEVFPLLGVTHNDCTLTFLPYSHVLGRMELWGSYFCGYTVGYAESIEKIKKNLLVVKPTVIVGVPRIFEKIYFGIIAQIDISKTKRKVFDRALEVGRLVAECRKNRKSPSWSLALKYQIARKVVFRTIHEKLGGNLRFTVSGGAPLDPEIGNFFESCGLPILEGYGLTESTAPIFINTMFESKPGTVGKAIGEVRAKLDDDGEILIKSKKIMKEYYRNPEATQKAFTEDGYFRTGDIGEIDSQGFLKITDRKKDLIKTAGGKFIAPQKLQNLFATAPLIDHIHVHGDKKKYVVALVTLAKDHVLTLKKQYQLKESSFEKLVFDPTVENSVRSCIAEVNQKLASYETIKRYKVLDHEFSIEGGQLTPSLKMKRKRIDELYKSDLDSLYQ